MDFDPDAYLASKSQGQPSGFDPDAYLAKQEAPKQPLSVRAAESMKASPEFMERLGTGIADPVWGAMQLASHVLPKSVVNSDIVDQMVKDREAEYAAKRSGSGIDLVRMAGNIANPVNLAMGGASAGASLGAKVAAGAAASAASSLLNPVTQKTENYTSEKGKQVAEGAAIGGAIPLAGEAVSRVIWPHVDAAVKSLMGKGITPTVGEILGGVAKSTEEKLSSLPFIGDVIAYGKRNSIDDMNKALYNMALEPIGQTTTAPIGRKAVKDVYEKLGDAYRATLQGRTVTLDNQFANEQAQIYSNAAGLMSNNAREQLKDILNNTVLKARTQSPTIDGQAMKQLDSQLGLLASRFGRSPDPNQYMIGDALEKVKDALRGTVARSNPDIAADLAKINQGYSVFARIRNAASRTGSKEGVILPSTLDAAVRSMDNSVSKGGTAMGTAPMRAFADEVKSTLGDTYKDSGTTGRMLLNLLLTGGAMHVNPASLLLSAPLTLPYLPGVRKAAAMALTARPAMAQPIAQGVEQAAQYAAPGIAMDMTR